MFSFDFNFFIYRVQYNLDVLQCFKIFDSPSMIILSNVILINPLQFQRLTVLPIPFGLCENLFDQLDLAFDGGQIHGVCGF